MAKPSKKTPEQQLQIVLAGLRSKLSAMEAARRSGVSEQSVQNWKRLFLESGREGLEKGARRASSRAMELEAENEELKAALGEAHGQLRVWKKGAEYLPLRGPRDDPPRRTAHGLEVRRAHRRSETHLPLPARQAAGWRAGEGSVAGPGGRSDQADGRELRVSGGARGGHCKIWAVASADGHDIGSPSSVKRAMARRDLLQPVGYQMERRQLARERRETFLAPPTRRNRVWQFDCSEFETDAGRTCRMGGTLDYWAKTSLACRVATTQSGVDMIAALQPAIAPAGAMLGRTLASDCIDVETGEVQPLVIVTDTGPAMRSIAVARGCNARPHLKQVRTRHKAPETNGVIERWFESQKYERLYRHDIDHGLLLGGHAADILGITPAAQRQRPSRAGGSVRPIIAGRCGLAVDDATCSCARQVNPSLETGIPDRDRLPLTAATHIDPGALPTGLAET